MNVHSPHSITRFVPLIALAATLVLAPVEKASADPILFDSMATIQYAGQGGGVHYYDLKLSSFSLPYHDVYIVLDTGKVVSGAVGGLGGDAQIMTAELLSHPSVDLFYSADRRAVANINNPRLLNDNEMDAYDPLLTDPLPTGTMALTMRLGFNRSLLDYEPYQLGYWVGDLRGMIDPNQQFTESDGTPVPEPATLLLALGGMAGLLSARRRRRN